MFKRKGPSELEVARENEVKIAITQELSKALKTVQKENVDTDDHAVYSTETANSVCSCIEAVFLHGLKSKAITKIASYVGVGQQATAQASLNFWNFVVKFTHGEVIAQLKHLGQITTEIGLCRAWVRVALNDGIMESYIDAMIADRKTLDYFYQRTAYLRDAEQPGIMKTYLQGLMHFEFKLSYNASVLNEWSYTPLVLAGVIGSRDAPPPVIKPPVQRPKGSKSKETKPNREQQVTQDTSVEVTRVRSRSKGSIDLQPKKHSHRHSDNPMEQPQFGPPSNNSYFITSSEFTSQDVEDFKKLSKKASSVSRSECSSSSHISCPDPGHMNVSPANYVRKMYGGTEGSPSSDISSLTESQRFKSEQQLPQRVSTISESSGSEVINYRPNLKKVSKDKSTNQETKMNEAEQFQYDADVEIDVKVDSETEGDDEVMTSELEDSWKEFYKSPVKKVQEQDMAFRKVQRLESINRDMREEAILNSLDVEQIQPIDSATDMKEGYYEAFDENADSLVIEEDKNLKMYIDESAIGDAIADDDDVSKDTMTDNVTESSAQEISGGTSELLDLSQKLLNELGIEEPREPVLIEEKVVLDTDDDSIEIATTSPKKKKKSKGKSSMDKLKPNLSLSPPKAGIVPAEMSHAVADRADQIKTLENPDYLRKHRLSLPVNSINSKKMESTHASHRQSVPNVLDNINETNGLSRSPYSIEDYLYKGGPLEDEDVHDGSPYSAPEKSVSPSSEDREESTKGKRSGTKSGDEIDPEEDEIRRRQINDNQRQSVGNNLMFTGRGWSSSFDSELEDTVDALSPPRPSPLTINRPKAESFGTLLQNYTPGSSLSARSIEDVLASLPESVPSKDTLTSPANSPPNEDVDGTEGFEVVHGTESQFSNEAAQIALFSEIANEKGLDAQNFQCKGCARAVGLIFGKPRVCRFDGGYYCYECHESEEYYMPALIVHNWDFRKHKVSKKNLTFIQDHEDQPFINIEDVNPRLYEHVPEMLEIQSLRMQMLFLKTYLFSCKQSIAEDLRRLVWPRDYLFENTELYSLTDLLQVPGGGLASSLRKVIKFATKHVYSCRLCSQKGFICELCNNPKVIYAFETEATYRCPQCKSVYHKECKTDNRDCPKCARRLARKTGTSDTILTPDYDLRA